MRRLPRLRSPVSLVPIPPSSPSITCSFRCFTASQSSRFSSSRPRHLRPGTSNWLPDKRPDASSTVGISQVEPPAGAESLPSAPSPIDAPAQAADAPAEVTYDAYADVSLSEPVQAKVRLPPTRSRAPRVDDVTDPSYQPAVSGDGLEEVGGLEGWFEQEENWTGIKGFTPFGPQEKVWDAGALVAIARRAVAEALAVRDAPLSDNPSLAGGRPWHVGGRDAAVSALGLEITVAEDGSAKLSGGDEAATRVVGDLAASEAENFDDRAILAAEGGDVPALAAGEIAEITSTWDDSWKNVSLRDLHFKFAVAKRIQQLSGQIIPDSKLMGVGNVRTLLDVLVKRPRSSKLAEEICSRGDLLKLSNVTVHNRRVTPIDKDKAVGRWKVVVRELEKRDLPVTGTGKYGRSIEKAWVRGHV